MDIPDRNGYVADDYQLAIWRPVAKAMQEAINEDDVVLWGYTTWGCIDLVSAGTVTEMKKRYSLSMVGTMKEENNQTFRRMAQGSTSH